ncbi:hypothetical protein BCR42DRAFT_411457 [Absidia repens]|uniref:RAM signaling pathway protein-domain-containing protein n=1 Tax=Absidia repens TaxID=90262 RepID=A0A1X2ILR5_9FUNG|nr:hypothetical protein BCR42DRAFT_411457 [Absidia repens]
MEPSVSEGNHGTARSKTSRTLSTVAGLSMNKHGLSMNTLRSHRPQQVYVALPPPPSNVNNSNNNSPPVRKHSLDSKTMGSHHSFASSPLATSPSLDTTDDLIAPDAHDLILPCRTIVFAASTLHDAMKRCLLHISTSAVVGDNAPLSFFIPLLQQLHSAYDPLEIAIAPTNNNAQQSQTVDTLMPCVNRCLNSLKEICTQLQSKVVDLAQVLDLKILRHLLLAVHGVTFDIKDAWQLVVTAATTTTETVHGSQQMNSGNNISQLSSAMLGPGGNSSFVVGGSPLPSPQATRNRSHSENITPSNGKQQHTTATTSSGLYAHLRMAVAASSQLVDVLTQSMDTMLRDMASQRRNHGGLEEKLMVLRQPMQQATGCSQQLNEHLDTIQEHGFTSHKAYTVQFWEDTNLFLKTFVSLMSLIRSLSSEEDINWPKSVKQCCLHVTRITAEIAKLWNNDPTFVQDGYYLGRAGCDDSTSATTTPSPASTATTTAPPLSSSVPSSSNNVTPAAISLSSSAPSASSTNVFIPDSNVSATTTSTSSCSSFLDIPIPPK